MTLFRYGFVYKTFTYGWLNKKLYRLPLNGIRCFPLKELQLIKIGENLGYRVGRDKKTIKQLLSLTTIINICISIIQDEDVPF